MRTIFLTILKTLGDFFLDAKGDGDPMRFLAIACFIAAFIEIPSFWEMSAGCGGMGALLFVLAIWHDKIQEKKTQSNPTQGIAG